MEQSYVEKRPLRERRKGVGKTSELNEGEEGEVEGRRSC